MGGTDVYTVSLPPLEQPINILDITVSYENHAILTKDLPTYQHTWNSSANHDPSPEELCVKINALAGLFRHAPDGAIPPPPNNVDKKRSEQVGRMKEEGNVSNEGARCRSVSCEFSRRVGPGLPIL